MSKPKITFAKVVQVTGTVIVIETKVAPHVAAALGPDSDGGKEVTPTEAVDIMLAGLEALPDPSGKIGEVLRQVDPIVRGIAQVVEDNTVEGDLPPEKS